MKLLCGEGVDGMYALPEDLLYEVLSRVGNVKDLFMLAVACQRWLRRFTDPAFLCGLWGVGHRTHLLGFFFKHQQARCERMVMNTSPTFLPVPGSPICALTSFNDDGAFNYAQPLATRRGIVLMQLDPRTFRTDLLFGLCNPITGERHILPRLLLEYSGYVSGYAIITVADSNLDGSGCFAFSQLLLLTDLCIGKVYLQSYSTATRSWSAPIMCPHGPRFLLVGEKSAVVHQGAAHWLLIDHRDNLMYKLSTKTELGTVSLTELPVRVGGSPLLCVSRDGNLSVACVYLEHLTVWTQQQCNGDDVAVWLRTAVIRIPTAVPNPNYPNLLNQPRENWFHFNKGSMVVLCRSSAVFLLDLEKKVMEKIMEDCLLPRFSAVRDETKSVPYKMDLVEFFLLQLGGKNQAISYPVDHEASTHVHLQSN